MFADKGIPERFRYRRGVSPGFRQGCGFSARARRLSAPLGHGRYRDHDDGVSEHKFDVDIREGQAMDLAHARSGLSADRLERITDHLNRNYIEPGKITGCQVAVSRHGHLAYFKSFGDMDRERGKATADDTLYRIYSMSKPITSVALMTLFEQGYFQLDDPVSRHVPEWKDHKVWVAGDGDRMELVAPNRPLSFRHVLSHTGGLTYGSMLAALGVPDEGHPVDKAYAKHEVRRGEDETLHDFVMKLAKVPLRYQPGEQWMYSL